LPVASGRIRRISTGADNVRVVLGFSDPFCPYGQGVELRPHAKSEENALFRRPRKARE
jgi:hypothetical protein